jgi:uncharacterized protein YegL
MNKDYTHISMVIDRSGSMSSCWSDVVGGYKQLVEDNKGESGKCTFTVAAFDTEYELVEDFTGITNVDPDLKVKPRGGTALLDAIGKTIVSVGEKLAKMDEADRPMKVMMLVQTDGMENASNEFKREDIKKLIEEHTNVYKWQFQFLGADLTSVNEAKNWGFNAANTSVYATNNSLDTFTLLSSKMKSARSATTHEQYTASVSFSDSDKDILNSKKVTANTK